MFILTNLFLNFNFHDDEIFTRSAKYFFFEIHAKNYRFSKTTRFSSWTMINSDQRHVFSHLVVQSYHKLDVLQHYFIISLLLVSVTRSLSPFLVIVVTISVCHMICCQLFETFESFDSSKNSKTGILDSGRVISVFRVISPVFKRWLHFGKLRVPSFFITKYQRYHRSIKMDYYTKWIIIQNWIIIISSL